MHNSHKSWPKKINSKQKSLSALFRITTLFFEYSAYQYLQHYNILRLRFWLIFFRNSVIGIYKAEMVMINL